MMQLDEELQRINNLEDSDEELDLDNTEMNFMRNLQNQIDMHEKGQVDRKNSHFQRKNSLQKFEQQFQRKQSVGMKRTLSSLSAY